MIIVICWWKYLPL